MMLHLIRHGEAAGDPHAKCRPPVNAFLTELGCAQAAHLGVALSQLPITAIYSSPLGRAVQTAQSLAAPRNLPIQLLDWLIEWQPAHVMEGRTFDPTIDGVEQQAVPPEQAWKTTAGEGTLEMAHRLIPNLLQLLASHGAIARYGGFVFDRPDDKQHIVLVAHGGCLGQLLAYLLGIPLRPYSPLLFEHTGFASLMFVERCGVFYPTLLIRSQQALNAQT